MKLRRIEITICEACLDGVGRECHTPGCALFLHAVDLPIAPEAYEVKAEWDEVHDADCRLAAALGKGTP